MVDPMIVNDEDLELFSKGGAGAERIPPDATAYFRSTNYTVETTPEGLKKDHSTKKGVWGLISVLEGAIEYVIPDSPDRVFRLDPKTPGVTAPQEKHRIKLLDEKTRFFVEFYRIEKQDVNA